LLGIASLQFQLEAAHIEVGSPLGAHLDILPPVVVGGKAYFASPLGNRLGAVVLASGVAGKVDVLALEVSRQVAARDDGWYTGGKGDRRRLVGGARTHDHPAVDFNGHPEPDHVAGLGKVPLNDHQAQLLGTGHDVVRQIDRIRRDDLGGDAHAVELGHHNRRPRHTAEDDNEQQQNPDVLCKLLR